MAALVQATPGRLGALDRAVGALWRPYRVRKEQELLERMARARMVHPVGDTLLGEVESGIRRYRRIYGQAKLLYAVLWLVRTLTGAVQSEQLAGPDHGSQLQGDLIRLQNQAEVGGSVHGGLLARVLVVTLGHTAGRAWSERLAGLLAGTQAYLASREVFRADAEAAPAVPLELAELAAMVAESVTNQRRPGVERFQTMLLMLGSDGGAAQLREMFRRSAASLQAGAGQNAARLEALCRSGGDLVEPAWAAAVAANYVFASGGNTDLLAAVCGQMLRGDVEEESALARLLWGNPALDERSRRVLRRVRATLREYERDRRLAPGPASQGYPRADGEPAAPAPEPAAPAPEPTMPTLEPAAESAESQADHDEQQLAEVDLAPAAPAPLLAPALARSDAPAPRPARRR